MMKRFLTVFLSLCLLLGCMALPAAAETVDTSAAASLVDVVIVLDMTTSMGNYAKSDATSGKSQFHFIIGQQF